MRNVFGDKLAGLEIQTYVYMSLKDIPVERGLIQVLKYVIKPIVEDRHH